MRKPHSVHSIDWKRNHYCAHIWNDVYRFNIYVYWPITASQRERVLSSWFGEDHGFENNPTAAASVFSASHEDYGRLHLVFFREWAGDPDSWALLAHEAAHLANDQMTKIGQELTPDHDEPYAYLVEWIVKNAGGAMEMKRKK